MDSRLPFVEPGLYRYPVSHCGEVASLESAVTQLAGYLSGQLSMLAENQIGLPVLAGHPGRRESLGSEIIVMLIEKGVPP